MADVAQEIETTATDLLREAAQHYGAAATEYGKLLNAYGRGESNATDLAKSWFNLTTQQWRNFAETGFRWGIEYYKWTLAGVGVKVGLAGSPRKESSGSASKAKT